MVSNWIAQFSEHDKFTPLSNEEIINIFYNEFPQIKLKEEKIKENNSES